MQPVSETPLEQLNRIQGQMNYERGVLATLRELSKGRSLESLFVDATRRLVVLEDEAERLKRKNHGTK